MTPGLEVIVSIPAVGACSLLVASMSVWYDQLKRRSWSPCFAFMWQRVKMSDVNFRTLPPDSLAAGEDVKWPARTYFSESSLCLCIALAAHDNRQISVLRPVRKIYKLGTMDKNDSFTQSELFVLSKFGLHYFTHGKKMSEKKKTILLLLPISFSGISVLKFYRH